MVKIYLPFISKIDKIYDLVSPESEVVTSWSYLHVASVINVLFVISTILIEVQKSSLKAVLILRNYLEPTPV